jgi:hypothetical protein
MKNKQIISPVGLKGNQILERQLSLMGIKPINENENKTNSAVELTKIGPDDNAYAIVRENHEYYIKRTDKKSGLVLEDFKYIGGLQNKKDESYPTYARAIKQLNFKFKSLAEAFNKGGDINVFEDDNLLSENARAGGFSQMEGNGFSGENNFEENKEIINKFEKQYGDDGESAYYATANKQGRNPETFEKNEGMMGDDVEEGLNEFEQAIEEMMAREDGANNEISHDEFDLVEYLKSKLVERGMEVTPENISMVSLAYEGGTITDLGKIASILTQMNEELSGKQYKIDANHNGEIDGGDFPILNSMEESIKRLDKMITSLSEGTVKKKVATKK